MLIKSRPQRTSYIFWEMVSLVTGLPADRVWSLLFKHNFMPRIATLQRLTSEAWSCLSLPAPFCSEIIDYAYCLENASTDTHLLLCADGILIQWRSAETHWAHVFWGFYQYLTKFFLLPLHRSSIKERKHYLGNILDSPVEMASRDVIVAHRTALLEQAAGLPEG